MREMGLAQNQSDVEGDDFRGGSSTSDYPSDNIRQSPVALASLIEGEIIPRLLFAHRSSANEIEQKSDGRIAPAQAEGFAPMVLRLEAHALFEEVEGFLARGASVEAVLVDLLAPAARQLGVYWEEDTCDFVDVTMGLWRLQQLVHELSSRIPGKAPSFDRSRRALFSVFPGEQHSLGTVMVEECFRRKGWVTDCFTSATEYQLLGAVRDHSFDLVGLTISYDSGHEQARNLIAKIRTTSRNPMLGILVGGRILTQNPELALQMGADATALDAEGAVVRAEILMELLDGQALNRC
jgi:MerR family transcriptional regulator, light-induced transcriptional regulator